MSDDALAIISEYAESPIAENRRNAATALAAVGTAESVQRLATLALEDGSVEVRERSEYEIARLKPETAQSAVAVLLDCLRDKRWAKGAYQLLGRLRNRGVRVPARDQRPFLARLRTAGASVSLLQPSARWRPRFRPLLSGLVGGLAGALLIGVVLAFDGEVRNRWELGSVLGAGTVLSMVVALFASQRINPFNLHFDRTAGFLVELLWVGFGTALLGALSIPIFAVIGMPIVLAAALPIMLVGSMIAVRFGTLLTSGQFRSAVLARLVSVLVGAGSGTAALSLAAGLERWVFEVSSLLGLSAPTDIAPAIGIAWIALLPASFGAAWGFSAVEAKAPSSMTMTSSRRHVALTALAAYVACGVIWLFGADASAANYVRTLRLTYDRTVGVQSPDEFSLRSVPAAVPLKLESTRRVNAVLKSPTALDSLVLLVYRLGPQDEEDSVVELSRTALVLSNTGLDYFYPPTLGSFTLEAGTYALVVDDLDAWRNARRPSVATEELFERTIARFSSFGSWLLTRTREVDARSVDPYQLTVQIDAAERSRLDRFYGLEGLAETLNARLREQNSIAEALQRVNGAALDATEIEDRDRDWQRYQSMDPLVQEINASGCSQSLRDIQSTMPGLREIFVTGIQGVNVCQSNITTDYYQADETWWTDVIEAESVRFGEEEIDPSVETATVSISMPIRGSEQPDIIGIAKAVFDASFLYEVTQR